MKGSWKWTQIDTCGCKATSILYPVTGIQENNNSLHEAWIYLIHYIHLNIANILIQTQTSAQLSHMEESRMASFISSTCIYKKGMNINYDFGHIEDT